MRILAGPAGLCELFRRFFNLYAGYSLGNSSGEADFAIATQFFDFRFQQGLAFVDHRSLGRTHSMPRDSLASTKLVETLPVHTQDSGHCADKIFNTQNCIERVDSRKPFIPHIPWQVDFPCSSPGSGPVPRRSSSCHTGFSRRLWRRFLFCGGRETGLGKMYVASTSLPKADRQANREWLPQPAQLQCIMGVCVPA